MLVFLIVVLLVSMLEQKFEKSRFARVDADIIDRLIVKEERHETSLTEEESANLSQTFRSQLPKIEKVEFSVEVQDLGENAQPVLITQNEWMRRMKDISHFQSGMNFYAQMPDAFSLVLNSNHRLVKQVLSDEAAHCSEALKPVLAELKGLNARLAALRQSQKDKKAEEITQEEKDEMAKTEKAVSEETEKKNGIIADYAASNQIVKQLIDLALLQNGMLKGAGLDAFLKRSIDLIK